MRRFLIAFGYTVHSFGREPFYKRSHSDDFVVLFGREDRPGEWS
jgi:hypothetical protein